jgi:ubiquinone/menaquinone biosynthesis C-methylase UbiE
MPRFDADWIDFMLQPERRGSPPANQILAMIGLHLGQVVADVGCGPGFFTIPTAALVGPSGVVYAIDLAPSMLELVQSRAAAADQSNVTTCLGRDSQIPLGDAAADVTICGLVLHDLSDREAFVRELARITRPSGVIAVTEWTVESDFKRPNRVPPEELARLLRGAGRDPGEPIALPPKQYMILA